MLTTCKYIASDPLHHYSSPRGWGCPEDQGIVGARVGQATWGAYDWVYCVSSRRFEWQRCALCISAWLYGTGWGSVKRVLGWGNVPC